MKKIYEIMKKNAAAVCCAVGCFAVVLPVALAACTLGSMGMGEEVDIQNPSISISTPLNNSFVKNDFEITGLWDDNVAVTRIVVSIGDKDSVSDLSSFDRATIDTAKKTWSMPVKIDKDGTFLVTATAYDAAKNSMKDMINLTVDCSPAAVKKSYITRYDGGPPIGLKEAASELSDMPKNYTNIDYFQNEAFTITVQIDEDYGMKSASLELYEVADGSVGDDPVYSEEYAEQSALSPTWRIDAAALSSLGGGGGLLEARVVSVDEADNSGTDVIGCLRWQPDADKPWVELVTIEFEDGKLHVQPDSGRAVDLHVYDDDALGAVYADLIPLEIWEDLTSGATGGDSLEAYMERVKEDASERDALKALLGDPQFDGGSASGRVRDNSIALATTSAHIGKYMLAILVQDDPRYKTDGEIWSVYAKQVVVQDQNEPSVIIENPTENTFPTLDNGTFSVEGYTLDNTGAASIAIAFIPSELGQGVLEDVKNDLKDGKNGSGGVKIWRRALSAGSDYSIGGAVYKRYNFSFDFDVFRDFTDVNGVLENASKLFLLYTQDESHDVFETLKLLAYTKPPVVSSNLSDLKQHQKDQDLTITFTATSDVGMKSCELEDITETPVGIDVVENPAGTYRAVIPASYFTSLRDENKTFRITAVDKLGNKAEPQYTLFISDLPMLEDITSEDADGTYKIGDEILFNASFSKSVFVSGFSGTPALRLYDGTSETPFEADYVSGAGSVTLTFKYTVKEGDLAAKLSTDAASPIDLNGGAITAASGENAILNKGSAGSTLQSKRSIAVDGVKPSVVAITTPSNSYYKEGETITFTVSFSEKVIASGSPSLALDAITDGAGVYAAEHDRPANGGLQQQFTYTVKSGDTSPGVGVAAAYFSPAHTALITDEAGNALALVPASVSGVAVIDTTPPAAPSLYIAPSSGSPETPLDADGFYSAAMRLVVKDIESGATARYSLDGGASWHDYNGTYAELPAPSNGETLYQVVAKVIDVAGNESNPTDTRKVTIKNNLSILAVTSATPDGSYSSGAITFTVSLSDAVGLDSGGQVFITIAGTEAGDTAPVKLSPLSVPAHSSRGSAISFVYTVPAQSSPTVMRKIKAQINLSGVSDRYGNKGYAGTDRWDISEGLVIDNVSPKPAVYTPSRNSGGGIDAGAILPNQTITIQFDENVNAMSGGTITIKPWAADGNWALPPVIKEAEWQALWQKLSTDDKKVLLNLDANEYLWDENDHRLPMETGTNSVAFKTKTSNPSNPSRTNFYRKTTHGLVFSGGSTAPDTATKYVLAFELGLHDDDGDEARRVLANAGYLIQEIGVTSSSVTINGSTVTVVLPEALPDGRQFEVVVSENAFADAAGNYSGKIDGWHIWSQEIAKPVIRVNRASYKGENPFGSSQTLPFVDVPVRIDCETPGADISYGILTNSNRKAVKNWTDSGSGIVTVSIADAAESDLTGLSTTTPYTLNSTFYAGDGVGGTANGFLQATSGTDERLRTARKDYVKAKASRFTDGSALAAYGYEGVFKTVMMMKNNTTYTNANANNTRDIARFRIEGSDGVSKIIISGFPFHGMPETSDDYGLDAYRILRFVTDTAEKTGSIPNIIATRYHFLWLSWEIVSPWNQGARCYNPNEKDEGNSGGNNQNPTSAPAGYGDLMFNTDTYKWT